jgi:hypothetical protein
MKLKIISPAADAKVWTRLADHPLEQIMEFDDDELLSLRHVFGCVSVKEFANHKLVRLACAITSLARELEADLEKLEENQLDEALAMSFPASDPIAMCSSSSFEEVVAVDKAKQSKDSV